MTNTAEGEGQWQPPLPPGPMLGQWQPPLLPGPTPALPQGVNGGQRQAPGSEPLPIPQAQPGYGPQQPPGPWQPMLPQGPPPLVYGQQQQSPLTQPLLQQLLLALGLPAQALGIPVVGEAAQARGVPAGCPAPAPPGAQVAAAALEGAIEGRGGRGMQDANKPIRRIHDKVDGKAPGLIYKGTSPGELSVHNNPVLFQDKIAKVLSTADGGIWALTPDRPSASGFFHRRPGLDRLTSLRRETLQEFIEDRLGTHDELTSTEIVEVSAIDGSFAQTRAQDVSATEWLSKLVRKGMLQSKCPEAAGEARNSITVGEAEAWKAASRRLVLVYRAYTADPVRPHVSEAAFFCRYITEEQLTDRLERLVQLLLPSAFDQSGVQRVVHEGLLRIQVEIRPVQVDYVNPTSPAMAVRAGKTERIFGGMVDLMSTRKMVHGQPHRGQLKGSSGPSPRLASIGGEPMAGVRQLFRQSCPDIAALLSKQPCRQAMTERLAAMDGGGDGYQVPVLKSHVPHCNRYDMEQQQERATSSPFDTVAAFTNHAVSTPDGTAYLSGGALQQRGSRTHRGHREAPVRYTTVLRGQSPQRCRGYRGRTPRARSGRPL